MKIKDAVADSGAQITIFPASLLEASGIEITGMRKSKLDLRAANNAKIDVQGVADATISALSPSGERFKTTSRVYIVRNVDKVYLSLDVLVGLRIVNEFFPVAGAGNRCAHCASASAYHECHRQEYHLNPISIKCGRDEGLVTRPICVFLI